MKGDGGEVKSTRSTNANPENTFTLSPFTTKPSTNKKDLSNMKKMLGAAINITLTEKQRQVAVMYYTEEKKIPEIAQILNINKSTVSRTLRRAEQGLEKIKLIYENYKKVAF